MHALRGSAELAEAAIISESSSKPLRFGTTPEIVGRTDESIYTARHVVYRGASSKGFRQLHILLDSCFCDVSLDA